MPEAKLSGAVVELKALTQALRDLREELAKSRAIPVNVTVHAMDSKSFLDHRAEIASALGVAIQEGHPVRQFIG